MDEVPFHKLFYEWGCDGKHSHHGIAGQSHSHGPTTGGYTFRTNGPEAHHHHDERCGPPPIIRILSFMCGLSTYQTVAQIKFRDGHRTEGLVGGHR